jgi:hypothetical protein
MAKQKNNVVTYGLSGKIGDLLIFRQVKGNTVVSKAYTPSKEASEKQLEVRKRFQQATVYAKMANENDGIRELYVAAAKKEKNKTAYNVAVADFFNAPDIETIDLSDYTGNENDIIRITVSDDFAVKSVNVQIMNADGSMVEEGGAVRNTGNLWIYTATQNNESAEGDKIVITASDLPGNIDKEEQGI